MPNIDHYYKETLREKISSYVSLSFSSLEKFTWIHLIVSVSNLRRLGRKSSGLLQNQKFYCLCRYVYKALAYKLFVFPNMVLG